MPDLGVLFIASLLVLPDSLLKLPLERSYLCSLVHFLGPLHVGLFDLRVWLGIGKRLHSLYPQP